MFGVNKLVNFVDLKTLKKISFGNWSTMGAQLNVSSLDALVEITLKPNIIQLNIQCSANL